VLTDSDKSSRHPFYTSKTMDDVALRLSVAILQIALTDLSDDLCDVSKRGVGSEHFDEYVEDIGEEIRRIDSSIREFFFSLSSVKPGTDGTDTCAY
jgi:hypothetical protein